MSFGVSGTQISSARQSSKNLASSKVSAKDSARSVASQNNDWNVFMNSAAALQLNSDSARSEKYPTGGRPGKTESKLNNRSSVQGDGSGQVLTPSKSNIRSETPTKRPVGADEKKSNVGVRRFNSQGNLSQSSCETMSASTRLQPSNFASNDGGFSSSRSNNAKLTTFNAFETGDTSRSSRHDDKNEEPVKLNLGTEEENRHLVRAMLQQKYSEKMNQQKEERNDLQALEEGRRRAREQKAKEARQEAIEELRKKREVMRAAEQEVQGQMAFLQENGAVVKRNGSPQKQQQTAPKSRGANMARMSFANRDDIVQSSVPNSACDEPEAAAIGDVDAARRDDEDEEDRGATSRKDGGDTSSQVSKTTVTLDELFETLKTLEKVEEFDKSARSYSQPQTKKNTLDWLEDLETREREGANIAAESFHLHGSNSSRETAPPPVQSVLSEQKIRSIMNYLDEVDTAERLTEMDVELERSNQQLDRPAMLAPGSKEIEELNELAAATTAEITQAMLTQRLELEEKRRSVLMLQKALNQQRELTVRHAKETEKEMKKRLDVQKEEYEEAVKRHLSFIDQLIDDKKTLTEKYEAVVKEMKTSERKYQDKVKAMQDSHQVELDKVKEMHAAAEKLRRERWIEEKTKKIKEMTVKGLEPEIQRLIAQHKMELKKIKSLHEAELLHSDERAAQKYVKMVEELREQLHQEKEAACSRERELARQTYEKQLQQEEEALQQQRRRLHAEVHEEKERLTAQAARQRQELDRLQLKLEESQASSVQTMRIEYEKARDEQERRHAVEVRQLREQLALEKAAWEENVMKKHEALLSQREREMHKHVLQERDKEIELVIERLEADNRSAREECERVAENRIKRIREKYESEMAELERNEKLTTEKYNQTKASLVEAEGENERLRVLLAQKEKDIADLKKLLAKLNEERDHVSDVVRQEFADRIVATEEENKRLKNEMSELKARHRIELERAKLDIEAAKKVKDEEMEEVHKRVKQAILKKEEVVAQLREQHEAALKRADHLEGLLEQQRKQLLAKK